MYVWACLYIYVYNAIDSSHNCKVPHNLFNRCWLATEFSAIMCSKNTFTGYWILVAKPIMYIEMLPRRIPSFFPRVNFCLLQNISYCGQTLQNSIWWWNAVLTAAFKPYTCSFTLNMTWVASKEILMSSAFAWTNTACSMLKVNPMFDPSDFCLLQWNAYNGIANTALNWRVKIKYKIAPNKRFWYTANYRDSTNMSQSNTKL